MSILSVIGRIARNYSADRARYLAARQIEKLPLEIQKDIGWPDASGPTRPR
ncbi:MAG: hypothetical protein J0H34_04445 [Rhizobiales bacterium]|nr:hypothetical protein [Hyphomicrobiales bacterium]